MIIEHTGKGYRVRPERRHEELYRDIAAIGILVAGLVAIRLLVGGWI
jgi:hypothetical protein